MRRNDENWVKKCMEFRVDGRRPRRAWLESVEADMAESEIEKEDVHDSNNWRINVIYIFIRTYRTFYKVVHRKCNCIQTEYIFCK